MWRSTKQFLWRDILQKNGYTWLKNVTRTTKKIEKSSYVCIVIVKKNSKMRLNEHKKKGCEKTMDDDGNQLTLNLYTYHWKTQLRLSSLQKVGMFWNTRQSWRHRQNQGATISLLQRQFHSHSKKRKRKITIL